MLQKYKSFLFLSSCFISISLSHMAFGQDNGAKTDTTQTDTSQTTKQKGKNEQVVVKAKKSSIVSKYSSAATKSTTPLLETPESVSVVTAQQMSAQNAQTLSQALRYTSGVGADQRGANSRYDLLTIRGFTANEYLDGMLLFNGQYYAAQQIDPYLLERIDVLKGPGSVLYGQSPPGGVIALTSKFANGSRYRHISIEGGNYNYVRGTVDLGDTFKGLDNLSWRLVATSFRQDGMDWYTKAERYAFQPSLHWEPTDNTALTVYARYQREPSDTSYQTFPIYGSIKSSPIRFPSNFYSGDPNFEKYDRTQVSVGYNFDYQISDEWKATSMARYSSVGTNYNQVYGTDYSNALASAGYSPGSQYMNRLANGSKEHLDTITLEERLEGKIHTGNVTHNVLLGVSWQNLRDSYDYGSGSAPSLDLLNPNYYVPITIPTPTMARGVTTNQEGIFLQDQINYKRLHVQLGFRNDWSTIHTRDHMGTGSFSQSDQGFTFRGGILYVLPHNISPYFNYSQSFQPLNQVSQTGQPFNPTRGEQYEVGVKYQPEGFNGFITAALFNLTQSNVLTTDPVNPAWSIQAGAIRSRGFELEAHTSPVRGLNLILSYTYQDVRYTKDNSGLVGVRPTQIPANMFSFWGDYTIQSGKLADLGGAIGIRYVGNTNGDTTTLIKTPAYTLIDAQAHYKLDRVIPTLKGTDIQFTAQNLTNKRYFTACYSQSFGCAIGQGRTVIGRVSYHW